MSVQSALSVGVAVASASVTDLHESFDDEHLAFLPSEVRAFRETGWELGDGEESEG